MPTSPQIIAIVPAAGRSTRMGVTKQLLPIDGSPMALKVAAELLSGGCRSVVVVTRSELIAQFGAAPANVHWAVNDDPDGEMIDTVRIGLRFWQDRAPRARHDGYLVCPGDVARVSSEDVRHCIEQFTQRADRIVVASHGGKRGHPLIIPATLRHIVHSATCNAGLNQLARTCVEQVHVVNCLSSGVLSNANWPADLDRS